jgi:hypothetical protein
MEAVRICSRSCQLHLLCRAKSSKLRVRYACILGFVGCLLLTYIVANSPPANSNVASQASLIILLSQHFDLAIGISCILMGLKMSGPTGGFLISLGVRIGSGAFLFGGSKSGEIEAQN